MLVGIIDALYRRTQITGIPKVTELVVSRLDSKTMLLSPQIIEKATKGMAQLQTVRITLSVDVIGDKWIFLVGRLLGAVRGLRHMSISSSSYYIKWVNLWDLLLPFEYYYHCSLKAAHVTMVMLRRWEVLQVVTLFGVVSWADLLISFFEKHKTTLRSFELIGCQLIDGYDGRLEDLHQEVGGVPQPFIWRWFFLSFKARTAPLMLEKLVFGDLSTGYPTPRRFAIHNGEATLWTEWVMGRKASEPFPGERPASGCPRRCLLCEDEINEGLPEVSNA